MLNKVTLYNPRALITAPKIHTDLLWDLSILFVSLGVLYFIGVFYFRNKKTSQSKIINQKKKDLSPIISEFLFFEENDSKDEKTNYIKLKIDIRHFLKDSFNRRIISEVLLDLSKDVSGDTQESLFKLYKELELHKDAYKKIESWRWEIVSKGIFELTQMYVAESYGFITKFINDKRGTIRKQAEIATVTLKQEGISHFLDTTRFRISEWQQLKLLEVLRNQKDFQPPKFRQWLTSSNKHVVLFSLRLIKHYNQNDAETSIIELVKHKNIQIKEEAIQCIKEFGFFKATDTLKLVFWNSSTDTKIAILGALAVIGTKDDLPFLSQIEFKESNFSVKNKAFGTINTIVPESVLPTEDIETNIHHNIPEDLEIVVKEETKDIPEKIETNMETHPKKDETIDNISSKVPEIEKEIIQEIRKEEIESVFKDEISKSKEDTNLDFLPLITSKKQEVKKEKESSVVKNSNIDSINDIIVNFQVIIGKNTNDLTVDFETVPTISNKEIQKGFNLDFLPLLTDEEEINNVSNLEVFYEEVPDIIYENEFSKEDKEDIKPDFLPVVCQENEKINKPISIDAIDKKSNNNIDTVYEEITSSVQENLVPKDEPESIDLKAFDVDFTTMFIEKEKEVLENTNDLENILNSIPKPLFYSERELEMLVVLEDIAAFGDAREIPLLQEYLNKEDVGPVRERIVELLDKFCKQIVIKEQESMRTKDEEYISEVNLIEELFANCDSESKLILLDEIVAVGDKKELKLLNKLLNDPDDMVRQKALVCIANLQEQINLKEEVVMDQVPTEDADSTEPIPLEYAFLNDYETELRKNNIQPSTVIEEPIPSTNNVSKKESSFLTQFYSFSTKIFEKLNG